MARIWPFRQLGLKVLSLVVAILLWMVVAGEETVERGLRVPLELLQFPAGLELSSEVPATVDVRVRGASGTLGRVNAGDIVAVLDIRGAKPGQRLYHLTAEQVRAPFGIQVVQVTPLTVALEFENTASRTVPVMPAIDGKPAAGFMVGKSSSDPPTVEVVGPASAVERVKEAITEPVSVAGASDRVQESVTVGLLDPMLRLKTPRAALVTVQIVPAPVERTLHNRPVRLLSLAQRLSATALPDEVAVSVRGSKEALARLDGNDVTVSVDLTGLGAGQYTLTPQVTSARDAGITGIQPSTVQVTITSAKD